MKDNAYHLVPPPPTTMVYRSTAVTVPRASDYTVVWDAVAYDHIGAWTPGNATRLYVPTGAQFVRLVANAFISDTGANPFFRYIYKNGSVLHRTQAQLQNIESGPVISWVVRVSAGDYFEMVVWHNRGVGTGEPLVANRTWMMMEAVG